MTKGKTYICKWCGTEVYAPLSEVMDECPLCGANLKEEDEPAEK